MFLRLDLLEGALKLPDPNTVRHRLRLEACNISVTDAKDLLQLNNVGRERSPRVVRANVA